MIEYSQTKNPNSIEELICEPLHKMQKNKEMEPEDTKLLMRLLLAPIQKPEEVEKEYRTFIFNVIHIKLATLFTFKIEDARLYMWLCLVCQTPGNLMLYLWYLQFWASKNNTPSIDLVIFCEKIFPTGFFQTEDLKKLWETQKIKNRPYLASDNLVDYPEAGMSIKLKTSEA